MLRSRLAVIQTIALALVVLLACSSSAPEVKCSSGETRCSGVCVDTTSAPGDCGGCGIHCASGASCQAGQCQCPAGQVVCGLTCTDLQSSASNCGQCGHECGLGTCNSGSCVCEVAPVATTNCGASARPECVDTSDDSANCGSCGHACASELPGSQCGTGTCQCLPPKPDRCSSLCTDLQTDAKNCGSCGRACPDTNDVCVGGACTCPAGFTTCGSSPGTCVNLASDVDNCGACGSSCPTAATCTSSACACPGDHPVLCGHSSSSTGACCAGTTCCGSGCQTSHSNGLGQTYYDCASVNQYTAEQAFAAAQAFAPSGTPIPAPSCPSCVCASNGSSSAVWCYAGSQTAGLVQLFSGSPDCTLTACPTPGLTDTHQWQ